jgi:hypothetical protein
VAVVKLVDQLHETLGGIFTVESELRDVGDDDGRAGLGQSDVVKARSGSGLTLPPKNVPLAV